MNQSASFVAFYTLLIGLGARCKAIVAVASLALIWATPALAGPPYITDDPDPTELGKWEVYAFADGVFEEHNYDGGAGLDVNYGVIDNVQLTATLPLDVDSAARPHVARGELEFGVKWRFFENEKSGIAIAVFPRIILPTSREGGRTSLLLPLWGSWSNDRWSVFGGGGYQLKSGAGTRDNLIEALAVTRKLGERLTLGAEIAHEGSDAIDEEGSTTLGLGAVLALGGPVSLLVSGGPQRGDRSHDTGVRAYAALGLAF